MQPNGAFARLWTRQYTTNARGGMVRGSPGFRRLFHSVLLLVPSPDAIREAENSGYDTLRRGAGGMRAHRVCAVVAGILALVAGAGGRTLAAPATAPAVSGTEALTFRLWLARAEQGDSNAQ